MVKHVWLVGMLAAAGCGASNEESKASTTTPVVQEEDGVRTDPSALQAEHFEDVDRFWKGKGNKLQFTCYNREVERTHKKYQGTVTLQLTVVPGGKVDQVKINASSLKSPEIEQCIVEEMKTWGWPDVPAPVHYTGSVSFKPAW